jgi:pilus assembly protein CpaB
VSPRRRKKTWRSSLPEVSSGQLSALAFLVATLLGGTGFYLAHRMDQQLQSVARAAQTRQERVPMVYLTRDIPSGTWITEDDVVALDTPVSLVPADAIRDVRHARRLAKERLLAHEPLREARLYSPESPDGLNAVIPAGMRALTIELADGAALSGHLSPTDHVDLLITDLEAPPETRTTEVAVQGVFVLAVGEEPLPLTPQQERDGESPPLPTVTLLVSPTQARRIVHATHTGMISLGLRHPGDDTRVASSGADLSGVLAAITP